MKKVYIVSDGDYSDYSIIAVFGKKEDAEQFKRSCGCAYLEEWDVDSNIRQVRKGYVSFEVQMRKVGDGYAYATHIDTTRWRLVFGYGNYEEGVLLGSCWAKSEQHALKIAKEKRAQLIALDRWNKENEGEVNL